MTPCRPQLKERPSRRLERPHERARPSRRLERPHERARPSRRLGRPHERARPSRRLERPHERATAPGRRLERPHERATVADLRRPRPTTYSAWETLRHGAPGNLTGPYRQFELASRHQEHTGTHNPLTRPREESVFVQIHLSMRSIYTPLSRGKGGPHTSVCLSSLIPSTMICLYLFLVLS